MSDLGPATTTQFRVSNLISEGLVQRYFDTTGLPYALERLLIPIPYEANPHGLTLSNDPQSLGANHHVVTSVRQDALTTLIGIGVVDAWCARRAAAIGGIRHRDRLPRRWAASRWIFDAIQSLSSLGLGLLRPRNWLGGGAMPVYRAAEIGSFWIALRVFGVSLSTAGAIVARDQDVESRLAPK